MVLVALLSARNAARDGLQSPVSSALLDFGGQSLIEYQARLALGAGAEKLIIHADAAAAEADLPGLTRMADHIARETDCPVSVVRDMPELARTIGPEDLVLLMAEGAVIPSEALDALTISGGEAVLVLPSGASTASFERLDASSMWGGAFCVSGARLLATLDMLGEWDLVLTLLRRAVQDGVERIMLPPEPVLQGRLAFLTDQSSADLALNALSDYAPDASWRDGGGVAALLAPLSRTLLRELMHRQAEPAHIALLAVLLCAGSVAVGLSGWAFPALLLMLPALGIAALANRYAQLTLRATGRRWPLALVQGGALLLLGMTGLRAAGADPLALTTVLFVLLFLTLFTFGSERTPPTALWEVQLRPGVPAALLMVLAGVIVGYVGIAFALLGWVLAGLLAARLFHVGRSEF
ncbi:hypothetical protein M2337_002775 [Sphingobium sp. B2D3A]|uniref:hypothetical protein n=1 Tax=unclassified Sphingobium TaxID=2611147 RepID=UPI002224DBD7|nr:MULTISPECIES: hypothetical protein [unclassified Sphingobium]MCW2338542.1 hypothetical protein [Sphingobium sp. B2D3A]MCW2385000.1 hypothetical protein [Sphingobium sp. B2D3D]